MPKGFTPVGEGAALPETLPELPLKISNELLSQEGRIALSKKTFDRLQLFEHGLDPATLWTFPDGEGFSQPRHKHVVRYIVLLGSPEMGDYPFLMCRRER